MASSECNKHTIQATVHIQQNTQVLRQNSNLFNIKQITMHHLLQENYSFKTVTPSNPQQCQ